MKKLCFALALLMIAAVFAACGGKGDTTSATTPAADITIAETTTGRYEADLPERDFGGESIVLYARIYNGVWDACDVLVEEIDGELINDALYEREDFIENTYNVKLELVKSGVDNVTTNVKTFIAAGDGSYDAVICSAYNSGAIALEGMLCDLNGVEYIDFSQPWWSQRTNESLSIGRKQYYATGDIFIIDNKAIRMFFFNKDMPEQFGLESPYQLVFDDKWTFEKYIEFNEAVSGDLNGDNQLKREDDRYGTMAQPSLGIVLYIGAGQQMTSKDGDDIPLAACNSDLVISIMTGISESIAGLDAISIDGIATKSSVYPDNMVYFMEGRVFFAPEVLLHIESMRGAEIDIGILPPPKYNESQEDYYCYTDGYCVNLVSIPVTNTETDKIGFIVEAMSAESMNNLTPAYYEVALTNKYVRDAESVAMLDLILDASVMDNANVFSWGSIEATLNSAMSGGKPIASVVEANIEALEAAIAKTVDAFVS